MAAAKFSYAGIAGAVAGVVALAGSASDWYTVRLTSDLGVSVRGTAVNAGKLALAMSLALFVFSAASVVLSDLRIRRAMGALQIVTPVVLTFAFVWGLRTKGGAGADWGLWLTGLGAVLGVGSGILVLKDAPPGADLEGSAGDAQAPAEDGEDAATDPAHAPVAS